MHQSSGISSRGSSRIPTKPSAVPETADTTDNNEPIKISSVRSPAKLLAVGWKKKSGIVESDYHRAKK
jgi:hypothetical protein